MPKRILSVGNCRADHSYLSAAIAAHFDADTLSVTSARDALQALRERAFDLVLINRIFDHDGDSGLDLIKKLKENDSTAMFPVMLISNHADAQARAQALGALPGFGKAIVGTPRLVEHLTPHLNPHKGI
jgi:CheY-like chemotaxis protein